jgi:hypothetical protein
MAPRELAFGLYWSWPRDPNDVCMGGVDLVRYNIYSPTLSVALHESDRVTWLAGGRPATLAGMVRAVRHG